MAIRRGVNRDRREVFLRELARNGSVRKACLISGFTRHQIRGFMRDDEEFAQDYQDALEDSLDRIEERGTDMARNGDDKMVKFFLEVKRYKKSSDIEVGDIKPTVTVTIGTPK